MAIALVSGLAILWQRLLHLANCARKLVFHLFVHFQKALTLSACDADTGPLFAPTGDVSLFLENSSLRLSNQCRSCLFRSFCCLPANALVIERWQAFLAVAALS